jgi:predicted transcriptional regulator
MKEEEIDWALYHLLEEGKPVGIPELCGRSGLSGETVASSLSRLEKNCLIRVTQDMVSLLSLSEMLMINELKYAVSSPVCLENGIIKVRKNGNET